MSQLLPLLQLEATKKKSFFWHDFTQKMGEYVLHGTDFGMRHLLSGWFLSVTALAIAVFT